MEPKPQKQHYTYGDYLTWPEDVRYELIDGQAYSIAPAPTLEHQDTAGEIYFQLRQALEGKPCRPLIAPIDVRLPKGDEAEEDIDTVVQPDVLVVCDETKLDRRGVRGAPDFVAEVLSPHSAFHDHNRKRAVYERAGVREYWLVDPTERLICCYLLEGGRYGKPNIYSMSEPTPVQRLPGVMIVWENLLTRWPQGE